MELELRSLYLKYTNYLVWKPPSFSILYSKGTFHSLPPPPQPLFKADTHEGFCSRSMFQSHFARVSSLSRGSVFKFAQLAPGACSQIFNRINIVEHFAGWKFCSRRWSIPMKSSVHTEEVCSRSVPLSMLLEQNPSCVPAFKIAGFLKREVFKNDDRKLILLISFFKEHWQKSLKISPIFSYL